MSEVYTPGYAVIVGVGRDLAVTVSDAQGIAKLLRDPSRCAYPVEQVKLLTEKEASREGILASMDWLAGAAGPDATAIVYFSGHGSEIPDYYLIPNDYQKADLAGTAISGKLFTDKLRAIKAKKLVVLLDCCHAGGQAEAKGLETKSPLPPQVIEELGKSSGRVIIASSRKDEVSWTGSPYSVYTGAALEALAGYGAFERDGYARVLDLAMYVGRMVPNRTKDQQNPIIKVANLEDNFALAYYAGGSKMPKSLDWTASAPGISVDLDKTQWANWRVQWANYRENHMLIEERMSEYVESTAVPLQLVRSKRQVEAKIAELEMKLRVAS
jgi:uncharacterized caspase-like protein